MTLLVITLLSIKYDSVKGSLIVLLGGEAAPWVQSLAQQCRLVLKAGRCGRSCRSGGAGGVCPISPCHVQRGRGQEPSRVEEPICSHTSTDLNALDALGHHVGVMHPHQRHVHASQLAQGSCPHACGESSPR